VFGVAEQRDATAEQPGEGQRGDDQIGPNTNSKLVMDGVPLALDVRK